MSDAKATRIILVLLISATVVKPNSVEAFTTLTPLIGTYADIAVGEPFQWSFAASLPIIWSRGGPFGLSLAPVWTIGEHGSVLTFPIHGVLWLYGADRESEIILFAGGGPGWRFTQGGSYFLPVLQVGIGGSVNRYSIRFIFDAAIDMQNSDNMDISVGFLFGYSFRISSVPDG